MQNYNDLQSLIQTYNQSVIQSEAEVRSKLVVPLLECLGYPPELRAEEFPVYGFEGRKRLSAKDADFLLFYDKEFAQNRKFVSAEIEWVQNHSLLVVEAKKPGEMPEVIGQPVYYTIWTRAVAYLATDGEQIKGYFYNETTADRQILDCRIDELPEHEAFWNFSYENLLAVKEQSLKTSTAFPDVVRTSQSHDDGSILTNDDEINLPEQTLADIRRALGRNAEGLGKLELVSRYLNMTDMYLKCKMRYDIPAYMFDIPREWRDAYLYVGNTVLPLIKGTAIRFYWNDYEKYIFTSDYIEIAIIYIRDELIDFGMGFRVLDRDVSERLTHFALVRKCYDAESIRIQVEDSERRSLYLPSGKPGTMWEDKNRQRALMDCFIEDLEKMQVIEAFYDFRFNLKYIKDREQMEAMQRSIDLVYDGLVMKQNCCIVLRGGASEDEVLESPQILREDEEIELPEQLIHGVIFQPHRLSLLPGTIPYAGTTEKDAITVGGCCLYKICDVANPEIQN